MKRFSALSTLQVRYLLRKYVKHQKTYVCAIDQLKYINEKHFNIVINNEEHDKPGMHWIGLKKKSGLKILRSF